MEFDINKHLIVLGIAVLLICVGLSGCNERTAVEQENKSPTASCSASLTKGETPLQVSFIGSGIDADGTIVSYHWDFDDGNTSTEQNPNHTFQDSGTYTVTITVTDDGGATATNNVIITVEEPVEDIYDDDEFKQWLIDTDAVVVDKHLGVKEIPADDYKRTEEHVGELKQIIASYLDEISTFFLSARYDEIRRVYIFYLQALKEWCYYYGKFNEIAQQDPLIMDVDEMTRCALLATEYNDLAIGYKEEVLRLLKE